jgi:hypothetical protein
MGDIDETFLEAEGAAGAEQTGKPAGNKKCLNCGAELKGTYCHECGQKDLPKRQTTLELLSNFVSSFSNYEGKFFLTVKYLILRPGFLAQDYNAGHRERYFHPVRMYAFISFVFFLIFFSLPESPEKPDDKTELTDEDRRELDADSLEHRREINKKLAAWGLDTTVVNLDSMAQTLPDSTRKGIGYSDKKRKSGFTLTKTDFETIEAYDSAQLALPEEKRDGWLERRLTERSIELNKRYENNNDSFGKDLWKAGKEQFPKMLFFLLPVFALLLKLLYVRRNYFYSEHLVFSIYFYNFFYFAGSLMMLAGLVASLDWLSTVIGWGIYIYFLFSLKRMYGQGWGKTVAKFFIFSFAFFFCLLFAFTITFLVIIMIL